MIYQKDKNTSQRLSTDMPLDVARDLPVLSYIDLEVTKEATTAEKEFVRKYREMNTEPGPRKSKKVKK